MELSEKLELPENLEIENDSQISGLNVNGQEIQVIFYNKNQFYSGKPQCWKPVEIHNCTVNLGIIGEVGITGKLGNIREIKVIRQIRTWELSRTSTL